MQVAIDLGRQGLEVTLLISTPLLVVGMVVGLIISVFQAATSIQEQTLTFVPKILAVVLTTMLILPWILAVLVEYTRDLLVEMPNYFQ
ncbi:MAG: flagellar biosynthesis protein FliQ [Planctomycetes bacterium]|nr:flagellar biosynthesis protein FliQ [Planctomycetota bacterium]